MVLFLYNVFLCVYAFSVIRFGVGMCNGPMAKRRL